ncbi:helix-turn-helix domain-containing protein [Streptomyces sp. UNOC14_S4]|nr:helix-turn-helix domain-containing protein [Streptomyces sp. UNOC14_S4]
MARGSADFSGVALRTLRNTRRVDGRLLSAAALGARVGTSKARILSYERGRSTPEPARIVQLAEVFRVSPVLLSASDARYSSIRDLRVQAGLTAAEVAGHIGVSRTTYRDIERLARLPVRDNGGLRHVLAACLRVKPVDIDRVLHQHPVAIARRAQITDQFREVFQRAHERGTPAVVEPGDPELLVIASLVQRAPTVICRLVNHELDRFRKLLKDRGVAELEAAYAQSERAAEQAGERQKRITGLLDTAPVRSADRLSVFLAEAMPAKQWRAMVALADAGPDGVALSRAVAEYEIWGALLDRSFADYLVRADGAACVLNRRGRGVIRADFRMYACLYPRVGVPLLAGGPAVTARPGRRRPRRSTGRL